MHDLFERGVYMSLGFLSMTKEQATKVVDELIEKGKVGKEEKLKILEDLLEKAENEKKALEAKIDDALEKSFKKHNIPTRKDIEEINKKLDQILKEQKKGTS